MASGTIVPGTSQSFASEIEKRADYIKTVVFDSPGGSVADAIAMGRLIREHKFATEVGDGKYCASAYTLVFAGGVVRIARQKAIIGVHQIAAVRLAGSAPPSDDWHSRSLRAARVISPI